jgi:hypothetical protein
MKKYSPLGFPSLAIIAAVLCLAGCKTTSVQSVPLKAGQVSSGLVYALPKTLVEVSLDLEYYVKVRPAKDDVPEKVTAVVLGLASGDEPVRLTAHQVPDWKRAFVLQTPTDRLTAATFKLEYRSDALLSSLNSQADDKSAAVIANTLGALVNVARMLKSDSPAKFTPTGVKVTLRAVVDASSIGNGTTPFANQLTALARETPAAVQALYPESKIEVAPTVPSKVILAFLDSVDAGAAPNADVAEWSKSVATDLKLKDGQPAPGIFYAIPQSRLVSLQVGDSTVATATISDATNSRVAFADLRGRRFSNVHHVLTFFENSHGLSKYEATSTSAAEGATGSLQASTDTIKQTVEELRNARITARDEAKKERDASESAEVSRLRSLASKSQQLKTTEGKIARLDLKLQRPDLDEAERDRFEDEKAQLLETKVKLETEIRLLNEGRAIPDN